jgi:WD40 repeat protein
MTAIVPADQAAYHDWMKAQLEQAIIPADDAQWSTAAAEDSLTAYRAYLEQFPAGRHVEKARQAIAALTSDALVRIIEGKIGHAHGIDAVAFTPDGRCFASSDSRTLILWDVATGERIRTYPKCFCKSVHGHNVLAITPDGLYVLYGGGRLALATGETLCRFDSVLAFSQNGRLGLSIPDFQCLRLFDTTTGDVVRSFDEYGKFSVLAAAFAPKQNEAAIFAYHEGNGFRLHLLDFITGEKISIFSDHISDVDCFTYGVADLYAEVDLEFSPNGRLLRLGEQLWDIETRAPVCAIEGPLQAIFCPDSQHLLVDQWENDDSIERVCLQDIATDAITCVFEPDGNSDGGNLLVLAISPNDTHFISARGDTARLWSLRDSKEVQAFCINSHGDPRGVHHIAISPDSRFVLSAGFFGDTIRLWSIEDGSLLRVYETEKNVQSISFSADGRIANYTTLDNGGIFRFSLGDSGGRAEAAEGPLNQKPRYIGEIAAGGMFAYCICRFLTRNEAVRDELQILHVPSGKLIRTFSTAGPARSAAISPDGGLAAWVTDDWKVEIWHIASGEAIWLTGESAGSIWSEFSPDSRRLFIRSSGGLYVFDIEGREVSCSANHPLTSTNSQCIAFSQDGRLAVAGTSEGQVILVDMTTANLLRTFEGHIGAVNTVTITPDGRYAVSGGDDTTIRIWDLARPADGSDFDALAWQRAKAQDTLSGYEHFLRFHPGSPHAEAAQHAFRRLESDRVAWLKASSTDWIVALEAYLSDRPGRTLPERRSEAHR